MVCFKRQEFFMINIKNNLPIGFNNDGSAHPSGKYIIVLLGLVNVLEENLPKRSFRKHRLNTNLNITGLNFEVAPGQCELQLRDEDIKATDDLIILRYIEPRKREKFDILVDIRAKPIKGLEWIRLSCKF